MKWFLLLVVLPALAYGVWQQLWVMRNLRRFWQRPATDGQWAREFPAARPDDIRAFLELFVDAFALSRKRLFCFAPDDRIGDVYRALYPVKGSGDVGETGCLYMLVKRKYGVSPDAVWRPDVTLGELFRHIQGPSPAVDGASPR
jgi:hypothetical protein